MSAKKSFCPAMWLSGFFGLGAVMHLVRFIARFDLVVNGKEISLPISGVLALVLGIVSVGLLIVSLKKPCDAGKEAASCCK